VTGVDTGADDESGRGSTPAPGAVGLTLAERHERLRALRRASRALDRRLAALAAEPAWDFADASPALRRKLKQAAARRLAREREEMETAVRAVDEFLAAIGPPRPPRAVRRR
jgi:hypothetical protein